MFTWARHSDHPSRLAALAPQDEGAPIHAPASLASAAVRILPVDADDAAPLTLPLAPGQPSVLEFLVRRVLATGTTAGLVIHRID